MSDKPLGPDDSQQELQEDVQDYLDLLLCQATEKPEAQLDQPNKAAEPPVIDAVDKPLPAAAQSRQSSLDALPESPGKQTPEPSREPEQSRENVQHEQSHRQQEERRGRLVSNVSPSLKMIGGTAIRPLGPAASSPRPQATPEPQRQEKRKTDESRPFAEPVKPIPLKWPVAESRPAVEQAPETEAPNREPVIPEAPAQESGRTLRSSPSPEPENKESTPKPDMPAPEVDEPVAEETVNTSQWLENGRPSWAQSPFECLLFSVGGLTLAVPLVELGTIFPMSGELTPLFGQIDWFMGLLPVKNGNIKTVNTAKVVMPERYREEMMEKFAYVISINGVDWGLAVDNVSNAITLDPADVRWRSERSKRPWLAGTVIDHMCALLDVSQLAAMFHEQDKSLRR